MRLSAFFLRSSSSRYECFQLPDKWTFQRYQPVRLRLDGARAPLGWGIRESYYPVVLEPVWQWPISDRARLMSFVG